MRKLPIMAEMIMATMTMSTMITMNHQHLFLNKLAFDNRAILHKPHLNPNPRLPIITRRVMAICRPRPRLDKEQTRSTRMMRGAISQIKRLLHLHHKHRVARRLNSPRHRACQTLDIPVALHLSLSQHNKKNKCPSPGE